MILIFGAARGVVLIPFILIYGLSLGAPLVLVPMLVAESLGLKRFGSIGGIAGIFNTLGAFVGPVGAGKIYDLTGSYVPAFEAFVVMCLLGAAVTYSCRTFEAEQSRQPSAPIPATA
jgi:nitrate/nitrite transporter NarK